MVPRRTSPQRQPRSSAGSGNSSSPQSGSASCAANSARNRDPLAGNTPSPRHSASQGSKTSIKACIATRFGSQPTARDYFEIAHGTFLWHRVPAFEKDAVKRIVKHPRGYLRDSGLLHHLLGIRTGVDLERHPQLGASWEGFALRQVVERLKAEPEECYFWATHAGAELDLMVRRGQRRVGFEFKRTSAPRFTNSMRSAIADLRLQRLFVVMPGKASFPLAPKVQAVGLAKAVETLPPL